MEFSFHTISYSTSKNKTIRIHTLKVVTTETYGVAVLDELIDALVETPTVFKASNTSDFVIIPFQNHVIGSDGMTGLLTG